MTDLSPTDLEGKGTQGSCGASAPDQNFNKREAALYLAAQGYRIFPLAPNSKVPPKGLLWKAVATTDALQVEEWWLDDPDYNIGVVTGDSLLVVDADVKNDAPGLESADALVARGLSPELIVDTPSGGRHLYVRVDGRYRNRAKTLSGFPGVDIRCENGYVVAPGSSIDGKPYVARERPSEVSSPAPSWFADLLTSAPTETAKSVRDLPVESYDLPKNVSKAQAYLTKDAPQAIEGSGGNSTTYSIAARLRDFALSERKALEMMAEHWNEAKANPPWPIDELAQIVHNAFHYAQRPAGNATAAADFEPIDIEVGSPPLSTLGSSNAASKGNAAKPNRFVFRSFEDAANMATAAGNEPLVDGLIEQNSLVVIYGKPNDGKTFIALDLAHAIASGSTWAGRETKAGAVFYIAAEGGKAIMRRLRALQLARGERVKGDLPFALLPMSVNLHDPKADVESLVESVNAWAAEAAERSQLIVVDTLNRVFGGGDENSGRDMTQFVANCDRLRQATGAAIVIIHHSGKDAQKGSRGHSSLLGAIDTELEIERDKRAGAGVIKNTKQRDGERVADIRFTLKTVDIGPDPKGRNLTSCVVEYPGKEDFGPIPLSPSEEKCLEALAGLAVSSAGFKGATISEWHRAYSLASDPAWGGEGDFPSGCSERTFRDLRSGLVDGGHVREVSKGRFART